MTPESAAALVELLESLRSDATLLLETSQAAQRASRQVEPPGAAALPTDEVARHVTALLAAIIAGVRGDRQSPELAAADELAVDRAGQGVTLEVLLAGVRAARELFLELLMARVRGRFDADQLIEIVLVLERESGVLQDRMIVAFDAAQASLARTTGTARLEALRSLVGSGDPVAAEELGLDPAARYVCVVADVSTPREARAAQDRLATADGAAGLVLGYLTRISRRLPDPDRVAGLLAVHTPAVPVEDLPAAHALCRQAIEVARRAGAAGLTPVTDHALAVAVAAEPLVGRLLAEERLRGLDPDDDFHRQLVETGQAFLAHGGRLAATAAALHLHPNTVTHRLRRLSALTRFATAESETSLAQSAGWWWAFSAWSGSRADRRGPS